MSRHAPVGCAAWRRAICALALALAVVVAGPVGGASAAVVGLERVALSSASNSSGKSVTATCPAAKRVVGAGGDVSSGHGDALIDDIRPSADLTSVTVNALEDETGTTAEWNVVALAICAHPPPGLQRVAATSALNSSNKGVSASCPAGKRLLGGGADINTFVGQVLLDDLRPNSGLTSVTANALEDETGNATNWSLTAYAICANPVQGLERVSATSPLDSSISKLQNAACPAGKQLTGVGGDINTFNGQVAFGAVVPDPALTSAGVAALEDETGNSANWSLTAYGICANSAERVVAASESNSVLFKTVSAPCPAGKQLTGVGGDLIGGLGQVVLERIFPLDDLRQAFTQTFEDGLFSGNWSLRAFAVCATPPSGLQRVENQSPEDSNSKSITVTCPAGKQVIGAGGSAGGPSGAGGGDVLLTEIRPNATLTSVTATGVDDEHQNTNVWAMFSYALCADPPPGLQRVVAASEVDSEEFKTVTATCPAGKHLLGTGAEIGGGGEVLLDDLRPNAALTSVTVGAIEDDTGAAADWSASAYAICANH